MQRTPLPPHARIATTGIAINQKAWLTVACSSTLTPACFMPSVLGRLASTSQGRAPGESYWLVPAVNCPPLAPHCPRVLSFPLFKPSRAFLGYELEPLKLSISTAQ